MLWTLLADTSRVLSLHATRRAVFKTNASYQRWDESRKAWGGVVNNCRTVMRESSAWIHRTNNSDNDEKYELVRRVADAVWLFARCLQRHLLQPAEDEEKVQRRADQGDRGDAEAE